jgi:predicted nucleic acid-binding protein
VSQALLPVLTKLFLAFGRVGEPAHDARLVAALQVHGISSILTFDRTGFSRFPGH